MKSGEIRGIRLTSQMGFTPIPNKIEALATECLELRRRLARMIRHVRTVTTLSDGREHRSLAECWLEDERRYIHNKKESYAT